MKTTLLLPILFMLFTSCHYSNPSDINIKFSCIKNPSNTTHTKSLRGLPPAKIIEKRVENGIEITVDTNLTGVPYYGKARLANDTLFLDFWYSEKDGPIPSVLVPLRFKYEITEVKYSIIKFNYLGSQN